jgi:VCBS repeat-containing protein
MLLTNHGSATSVSGTYGTLTIGSDGSYQYVASSDINNLDAGDANVTDVIYLYCISIGNGGTDY